MVENYTIVKDGVEYDNGEEYLIWKFNTTSSMNLGFRTTDQSPVEVLFSDGTSIVIESNPSSGSTPNTTKTFTTPQSGYLYIKKTTVSKMDVFRSTNNNLIIDMKTLPRNIRYWNTFVGWTSYVNGNVLDMPRGIILYQQPYGNINGNITDLPSSLLSVRIDNNSGDITGDVNDLNKEMTLSIGGSNYIYGDVANLPLQPTITIQGPNVALFGDLYNLSPNKKYFGLLGNNNNFTYTPGRIWSNGMDIVQIQGISSSTDIDNLIIDLSQTTWSGNKLIRLNYVGNASRTSASNDAVATLSSMGVSVLTN